MRFNKKSVFLGSILCVLFTPAFLFAGEEDIITAIDDRFAGIVGFLDAFLFWEVPYIQIPLIVLILSLGGIFFTFRFGFINIRGFKHSIDVIRGKYDNPKDKGEITHFQALTSALSATIGLGNIAGVAVAIGVGGPGAVFWMWLTAVFGMTSKFSCCLLAHQYRNVNEQTGKSVGGPMYYISKGFADLSPSMAGFGKALSILFAVLCIGGSFGGGNLFQVNQTYEQIVSAFPSVKGYGLLVGVVYACLVGLVVIGGIKRIGEVTSRLVPLMCGLYILVCLFIVGSHLSEVSGTFALIIREAFSPDAAFGGFIGVFINGVKRASFSNEAGIGSASIAHAAAKTDEPVREGIVAMIGPFIDTILVCTMTALVVVITGVYKSPELAGKGVAMTSAAFASSVSWFPYFLTLAVIFFAYSTIISWYYYGEKSAEYLFGEKAIPVFRVLYVLVVAIGPVLKLRNVIDFSDLMILGMAFPNIIAMVILSGKTKELLEEYWGRYKSGKMKVLH